MVDGNGLDWGDESRVHKAESISHVPLMSKQFTLVSGIISPPDSLVFYHSHPCLSESNRTSFYPPQVLYLLQVSDPTIITRNFFLPPRPVLLVVHEGPP